MEEGQLGILLPIIITLGAFVMVVFLRRFSNMERMAIIEKGLDPTMFKFERSKSGPLRWALLMIGVGIGLLLGAALALTSIDENTAYFSMIFIFGGIGLGVAYIIEEKKARS